MPKDKKSPYGGSPTGREAAPLDPAIIEKIKKKEEKKRKKKEQPRIDIPNNIPEHDPEEEERWKKERKDPRGIEQIDLA